MVESENGGVGETLESEKLWSRRNGEVGEMVEHSNVGGGEMVEHSNVGVGEMVNILATLESEKWWIAVGVGEMVEHNHDGGCSEMVAVKLVDYSIVIY
jgi:hypothetical protein